MRTTPFDQRPSGLRWVGDLLRGSHFCVFYASRREQLEVLVPFVRAGLEANEVCSWEVSPPLTVEEATRALEEAVPDLRRRAALGQVELIAPRDRPAPLSEEALARQLDRAILSGFDGLRLVRHGTGGAESSALAAEGRAIRRLGALAAYLYPRAELGAAGLMRVVQDHRFALVHDSGRWEVLEGSEARIASDALARTEEKLRSLFDNMSEGFAYHRIVLDAAGDPCDYVFLEVNPSFERLTGLRAGEILGKRVTQVLPGIEVDPAGWIGRFGRVALTGEPAQFESRAEPLDRWYAVSAFSPHRGTFAVTFSDITDRKRAEAERRAAEERLLVTLRSIGDAVIATDTEGRVTLMNGVAERLTGWTQPEASGRPLGEVFRIVDEDTGAPAEDPVSKVLARGAVVGLANHTALIARDGRPIAIADSAAPVRGAAGLLGVVLVFRDVTAERQAERERDLTLEFLRLVNASSGTPDLVKAAVGFFQRQSGSEAIGVRLASGEDFPYYEARGFPEDFLRAEDRLCVRDESGAVRRDEAGNPVLACACGSVILGRADPAMPSFTPDGSFWTNSTTELLAGAGDVDRWARARNRCHGAGYESVALIPLRVGDERLGLLQLNDRRPGRLSGGSVALWERLAGHLAVALARSRAAEARRASEARFKLLSDTAVRLLATDDPQGLVNELCRSVMAHLDCQAFFNFLVDAPTGRLRLNAFAGISDEAAREIEWLDPGVAICGCVARDGQRLIAEDVQRGADPRAELVRGYGMQAYCCHPLLAQGRVLGTLSFGTRTRPRFSDEDVTLMKTVTDQVAVAMQRVQAREELTAVNQQLVESDRRKNEFLAVLSHELRNPLAPISNSLYVLERAAPGGDQARRAREVIERQVAHLTLIVNDLLDVTRITRNKIQLHRQRVDLCELVRRSAEDQRSLFERTEIRLEQAIPRRPLWVNADETRMAQVVSNLLQNAAKFTGPGGTATISVGVDPARQQALVRVSDTGAGMAPETLRGLFQPFMQADKTLDRTKGGLGLGLALVKGLVELHGGEVSARSAGLGEGAEFTVRLPIEPGAGAPSGRGSRAPLSVGRRVLVIEDNVDAADSLREALELDDHEVAVAYTGPEGLSRARAFRPEVVLCDIGLPGMDGFEVARALRAEDGLGGVFLVALSGYAQPEDLERAREAGFERHLAKPPRLEKLQELLRSVRTRRP